MTLVKFDVLIDELYKFHFDKSKYLDWLNESQTGATTKGTLLREFKIEWVWLLLFIDGVDAQEC